MIVCKVVIAFVEGCTVLGKLSTVELHERFLRDAFSVTSALTAILWTAES
jgi:hypothetical protein